MDTTTITGCTTGVLVVGGAHGGTFKSYGNNNIVGNGTNIDGPKTPVQPQVARFGTPSSAP